MLSTLTCCIKWCWSCCWVTIGRCCNEPSWSIAPFCKPPGPGPVAGGFELGVSVTVLHEEDPVNRSSGRSFSMSNISLLVKISAENSVNKLLEQKPTHSMTDNGKFYRWSAGYYSIWHQNRQLELISIETPYLAPNSCHMVYFVYLWKILKVKAMLLFGVIMTVWQQQGNFQLPTFH